MKALARIAIAVAALALVGAAAGAAAPKVKLTVTVSGSGTVSSSPAGIDCKPKCTVKLRKGAKVVLTASPNQGAQFSHWSAPCGKSDTCAVKMTTARAVHAYFVAEPPPPPPPPPTPEAGHYTGTYSDGTFFFFDLSGTSITNVNFDFNGECADGGTSYDSGTYLNGPFSVGSDGSFSGTDSITFSDQVDSFALSGSVTTSGTASGTLHITIDFSNGPECTSTGTWTAQLHS